MSAPDLDLQRQVEQKAGAQVHRLRNYLMFYYHACDMDMPQKADIEASLRTYLVTGRLAEVGTWQMVTSLPPVKSAKHRSRTRAA